MGYPSKEAEMFAFIPDFGVAMVPLPMVNFSHGMADLCSMVEADKVSSPRLIIMFWMVTSLLCGRQAPLLSSMSST